MLVVALFLATAPQAVAVAPLDGLGVDPSLVDSLSSAVRKRVVDLGIELIDLSGPSCAGDVACLAQAGKEKGASIVVAGSVGLVQDQVHIVLKRIDVATSAETNTETARAPVDQAEARVRATALKLLDPQRYNTSGAILVLVNVSEAEVFVDGASRGHTPLLGPIDSLPPGRREVEVRAPGAKEPWRGFVDTPVDGVAQLELAVVNGKLVEGGGSVEPPPTGLSPMVIGGGAAVAVGIAAAAVGTFFYADTWTSLDLIERTGARISDEELQALKDRNAAGNMASGILLPLAAAAVLGGGAMIVLGLME